jgi:transposase
MSCPTPIPLRHAILRRWHKGQSVATIAQALGVVPRTVRHLVRRFRHEGDAAVAPSYHRAETPEPRGSRELFQTAVKLRQQHPTWGAGLIRVILRRDGASSSPPAERTLQRWFRRDGLAPAPAGRRPAASAQRAQAPHEVWQMDAKEQIRLASGERVSWLRIVDECSGAVLWTAVFPPRAMESGRRHGGAVATARQLRALGFAAAFPRG